MTTLLAPADAVAARAAVLETASRVAELLRAVQHPHAPALGRWDVTELAVHLSHSVDGITAMAKGGGGLLEEVWDLSALTSALVAGESRHDLAEVAGRIEAGAAEFVALTESVGADELRTWLVRGIQLRLSSLTCHVLNDLLVHGRDLALAQGVPWPIARPHARLALLGFLFPALDALGRSMVDQEAAAGFHAVFDVRLRGGGRVFLRFDDGDFAAEAPSSRRVDCHLSVDPAAFLLVAWGRLDQAPAIARGQLLAWGRRPWLGLKLRDLLRNP